MTFQSFPLGSPPAHYSDCLHLQRNGIFYVGEHVSFGVGNFGADTCTVRDYYGNIVSITSLPAAQQGSWGVLASADRTDRGNRYIFQVSPQVPAGGWKPGWYRAYLTGPNYDSNYGHSYGVTNFCVIRPNANFARLPASRGGYWGGYIPSGSGDADADADAGTGQNFGNPPELITRSCLGVGVARLSLTKTDNPDELRGWDTITGHANVMTGCENPYWLQGYSDPVRQRLQWLAFPNFSIDRVAVWEVAPYQWRSWISVYVKDATIDGSRVFISVSLGSTSGYKLSVSYPTSSTQVELYDNQADQAALVAAVNSGSAYVKVFADDVPAGAEPDLPYGPTVIGDKFRSGIIQAVSRLYPLGVTRFEGPVNEPNWADVGWGSHWVHYMMLFRDAVRTGHPNAKTIGPSTVNITSPFLEPFFTNGIGAYCDEISFHDYNAVPNGDINCGRVQIEAMLAMLAKHGQSGKTLWQTEANNIKIQDLFAVYHPRRARVIMARTLLWEQYGVPYERNPWWYDWSTGYWSYASFMWADYGGDKSTNPVGVTLCVLAQEVFGKNFHHRIDFGSPSANAIFLGNVYGDAATGSVAAILSASHIPNASVTLTVRGSAGPLTVVDGLGNETSVPLNSGRITVSIDDIPTYVRLPAGANVSVYSVNDWGPSPYPNLATLKQSATLGDVAHNEIADGLFMREYTGGTSSPGIAHSTRGLPDSAEILFWEAMTVERVLIWCGPCWQLMPGLHDYDIQTWDGATWTTRATVTKTTPSSFQHGASFRNSGTERETYWEEQWIEDVKLPAPVSCQGVRLYVRGATYGGEPDALMINDGTYDLSVNGMAVPTLAIQDIAVMASSSPTVPGPYSAEVLVDSPVGYWRLDEAPAATIAVSQVNSPTVDGTYTANPTLGVTAGIGGSTAMGGLGNTGYAVVPDVAPMWVGDTFSLEFWVNLDIYGYGGADIRQLGPNNWLVDQDDTGHVRLRSGDETHTVCTTTQALILGQWTHVVITKTGATVHMYINGLDVTGPVTNFTFSGVQNGADKMTIGTGGPSNRLLDEIAVYPTALSQARVIAHYRAGTFPGVPTNLTAPALEGAAVQTGQVSCIAGHWTDLPTSYSYQWQDSVNGTTGWANIGGETRSDYVVTNLESTKYLRCGVTANNPKGSSAAIYSNVVGPVT